MIIKLIRQRLARWVIRRAIKEVLALYRSHASYAVLGWYGIEDILDDGREFHIIIK